MWQDIGIIVVAGLGITGASFLFGLCVYWMTGGPHAEEEAAGLDAAASPPEVSGDLSVAASDDYSGARVVPFPDRALTVHVRSERIH